MFETEEDLVDTFVASLEEVRPWGVRQVAREFFYHRGRTDVVCVLEGGDVIAIEAKLGRWREALHQAYRNTCFAHNSYVLLPLVVAEHAAKHSGEFERRGVGLCTVSGGDIVIIFEPPRAAPLQPWLAAQAALQASGADPSGIDEL